MIHTARQSPKFLRLVRRLRPLVGPSSIVDAESVAVSLLERLWHATIVGAKRGDIGRFEDDVIAEMVGWMGDPSELVAILCETGWLDKCSEHRLVIHDWNQHAPNHVKGVVSKSGGFVTASESPAIDTPHKQPEVQIDETCTQGSGPGDGPKVADQVTDPGSSTQGQGPPNLTKPNPTQQNKTKSEESKDSSCSELRQSEPSEPPLMEFPVNGPKKRWPLTRERVDSYRDLYPHVNIAAECKKARQWLIDNPKRRKTAHGMPRFLTGWLSKANDRQSRISERDAIVAANNAHKPKPMTAETARYQLVKTFGIKDARDWSDEEVMNRYVAAIANKAV